MENKRKKPKVATKKHVARLERERRQVALVRTVAIVMFGVIALLIGYGYLDLNYLQLQKPVVEVNGDQVTVKQWQERVQLERINLANLYQRYQYFQQIYGMDVSQQIQELEYYNQSPEALGQLVISRMADEVLIAQEAERLGVTVSDEEVEKAIQEAYSFFPDGTPTPTITPTTFKYPTITSEQLTLYPSTATPTAVLTSTPAPTSTPDSAATSTVAPPPTPTFVPEDVTPTATPYTVDGFKSQYQSTVDEYKSYGISEETLRAAYKVDLLRKKVSEALTADIPAVAEQVWARHILVADTPLAVTVSALLAQGIDFAKVAQEYSIDTGSGANGGDLGWFGEGVMVPEFEAAAFSQPVGEIGKPVQSQFGYHIIQVLGREELPLTTVQLQQARDTAFSEWLTKANEDAEITTFDIWMQHIPPAPQIGVEPTP